LKPACIFCGNPPQNKNKEHIFPQWLLKLTGFDQKKASVGTNWEKGEEIVFNTQAYTFPSCTSCNSNFGKIESKVGAIFEKLMSDQDVTVPEIEILLDWFDKVRIGAWLGVKYMNKHVFTMDPKFYINSRVGLKDRYLSITNTYKEEKTLNWSGVNTIAFMMGPTAFSLRVNNLVFVNCSSDFVVSKQLGFPYIACEIPTPSKKKRMFNTETYSPKIEIAQPIYKTAVGASNKHYDHKYIREHSYEKGIGKLFISRGDGFSPLERFDSINFATPQSKPEFGHVEVVRPIIELQIELITNKTKNLEKLTMEQKNAEIQGEKFVLDSLRETMKTYQY
jgi:hypothetical protein